MKRAVSISVQPKLPGRIAIATPLALPKGN
mgnify:FL=1|jgi:hypothetical protein